MYFQFRDEELAARGISSPQAAETQVLGEILYQFLTHLELTEID